MFKPGHPKLGGRKPGTPNRKTLELMEVLVAHNFDPAAEMIRCYRDARLIVEFRKKRGNLSGMVDALKVAGGLAENISAYTYPKKKAVEHSGEVGVKNFADFIAAGLGKKK